MQIIGNRCKRENCTGIGGMEICGEREPRNDENCETEKKKLIHTVINKDSEITVMYTNADGLPTKMDELKSRIYARKVKPSLISVAEVKHKNKWDIDMAELSNDGYRMFANNYEENPRGIINYVRNDVLCK